MAHCAPDLGDSTQRLLPHSAVALRSHTLSSLSSPPQALQRLPPSGVLVPSGSWTQSLPQPPLASRTILFGALTAAGREAGAGEETRVERTRREASLLLAVSVLLFGSPGRLHEEESALYRAAGTGRLPAGVRCGSLAEGDGVILAVVTPLAAGGWRLDANCLR